jgi:hypothetical protein
MATLPDLDPTEVGEIAYLNSQDAGADPSSVDWSQVTDWFESYSVFDNGYFGVVKPNQMYTGGLIPLNQDIYVRIKTDGWCAAFTANTINPGASVGPWVHLNQDSNDREYRGLPWVLEYILPFNASGSIKSYSYTYPNSKAVFYKARTDYTDQQGNYGSFSTGSGFSAKGGWLYCSGTYGDETMKLKDSNSNVLAETGDSDGENTFAEITSYLDPSSQYVAESGYSDGGFNSGIAIWW